MGAVEHLKTLCCLGLKPAVTPQLHAGLWNRLTRHQDRSSPFRLMRIDSAPTREGLAALALMRRQELDGFIEGLFGQKDAVDLPERAHRGLDDLGELRSLFAAALEVTTH
jgi:hypothetical protein